jgi:aminopeptidase N
MRGDRHRAARLAGWTAALLTLIALGSTAAPAIAQQRGVDVLSYHYRVILPDSGRAIQAVAEIAFRRSSAAADTLALDLVGMTVDHVGYAPAPRGGEREPGFDEAVEAYDGRRLRVPLGRHRGGVERVRVVLSGTPADGLAIGTTARGRRAAFVDGWPQRLRHWLPAVDHPGDKAAVTWTITAPEGWRVVANGTNTGRVPVAGDRVTWTWRERRPIPTYVMVFGATPLTVSQHAPLLRGADSVAIEVWSYPEDSAYADSVPFRRATAIAETLQRLIGPFPYDRLAHVQAATRFGGMENAGVIFYDEDSWTARRMGEGVVRHETAHQWFGDAVTPADWPHLWLSEGFASYFDLVAGEALGDTGLVTRGMRRAADAVRRSGAVDRPVLDTAAGDPMRLLNTNSYQKGALILHLLRGVVGDSAFFRGVRAYYAAYRDSSVTSDQFRRVMERAAGTDLRWFFDQWLRQPGYPRLDVAAQVDSATSRVVLTVRQVQPAAWGLYRLPAVPVQLLRGGQVAATRSIALAGRAEQRVTLAVPPGQLPELVLVDAEGTQLLAATVHGP